MSKKHLTRNQARKQSYQHTRARAIQRYKLLIDRQDYENLCSKIQDHKYLSLIEVNRKKIYKVQFKNSILYLLYIQESNRITTALPYQRFERKMNI